MKMLRFVEMHTQYQSIAISFTVNNLIQPTRKNIKDWFFDDFSFSRASKFTVCSEFAHLLKNRNAGYLLLKMAREINCFSDISIHVKNFGYTSKITVYLYANHDLENCLEPNYSFGYMTLFSDDFLKAEFVNAYDAYKNSEIFGSKLDDALALYIFFPEHSERELKDYYNICFSIGRTYEGIFNFCNNRLDKYDVFVMTELFQHLENLS